MTENKKQLSPVEMSIDRVVTPNEKPPNVKEGELWATHSGVLQIGEFELGCHVLSNGQRIFDAKDIDKIFFDTKSKK